MTGGIIKNAAGGKLATLTAQTVTNNVAQTYAQKIVALFGSAVVAYWPLRDAAGTQCTDVSGHGYHGTYNGPTLGAVGIGDGATAASFDGTDDSIDISAALAAVNGAEMTLAIWLAPVDANFWAEAANRYAICLSDATYAKYAFIERQSGDPDRLYGIRKAPSTTNTRYSGVMSGTLWKHAMVDVSEVAGQTRFWLDGTQVGVTMTPIGAWSGALSATLSAIGAEDTSGTSSWHGRLAHALILNRRPTAPEISAMIAVT
jgi:hypothetical protein